jgi:hypothetical protein
MYIYLISFSKKKKRKKKENNSNSVNKLIKQEAILTQVTLNGSFLVNNQV